MFFFFLGKFCLILNKLALLVGLLGIFLSNDVNRISGLPCQRINFFQTFLYLFLGRAHLYYGAPKPASMA